MYVNIDMMFQQNGENDDASEEREIIWQRENRRG